MRSFLLSIALLAAVAPVAGARTDRLDRSFGDGRGWFRLYVGEGDSQTDRAIRTRNGKLLLLGSGYVRSAGGYGLAMARLHPSGRLDRGFGRHGRAVLGDVPGQVRDVTERPDGSLLIALARPPSDWGLMRMAVVRVTPAGRLDRSFGVDGAAEIELPADLDEAGPVLPMVVSRGRPVLAATTTVDGRERVVLVRFTREGRLDPSFGEGGIAMPDMGVAPVAAAQLGRLPDGRLVLSAGPGTDTTHGYPERQATIVVRLAEDGTAEPGWRVVARNVAPYDMLVEPGGGIAALVYRSSRSGSRWGVLRWHPDGRLRKGFERHRRQPPFTTRRSFPTVGFARDREGRFYVPVEWGAMARVRRDGGRDSRWAPVGVTRQLRTDLEVWARDVVVLGRGRVVSVGYAHRELSREDYGRSSMWVAAFR